MATKHVVDAHALVWFLEGNPRLGPKARAVLESPASELVVPIIALAEACWLVEHGKTSIPTVADLLAAVDADPRVLVAPLDRAVLDKSLALTILAEMHDRQILATGLLLAQTGESAAMLTKDVGIRQSGLISVVW